MNFAIQQPTMMVSGTALGNGIGANEVDDESRLYLKSDNERSLEKLQLMPRPFLTVPYLGKGSCNTDVESRLFQGECISEKKSAGTIMGKSFMEYSMQPEDHERKNHATNPKYSIEEAALDGWVRGGISTREISQDMDAKTTRPSW